jgi:tetratricopeptide (TPR) repeat protein
LRRCSLFGENDEKSFSDGNCRFGVVGASRARSYARFDGTAVAGAFEAGGANQRCQQNQLRGNAFRRRQLLSQAEELRPRASEKTPGKNSDMLRYYSDELARVYSSEGKYDKAEAMFKRAIALGEALPGKEKTYVVPHSLAGLAEVYVAQERFAEAETAIKKRIELRQRFMNAGQVDPAYTELANLYTKWGKLEQAKGVIDLLLTMPTPPGEVKTAVATYTAAVNKAN